MKPIVYKDSWNIKSFLIIRSKIASFWKIRCLQIDLKNNNPSLDSNLSKKMTPNPVSTQLLFKMKISFNPPYSFPKHSLRLKFLNKLHLMINNTRKCTQYQNWPKKITFHFHPYFLQSNLKLKLKTRFEFKLKIQGNFKPN